jgi:spermidine/putrescine transport system ATP-binding protein
MLEVKNIFKSYEGLPLLKGLSFSVTEGETVCLLGPSGSGKSTLLRIIAGLEEAESGRILWDGTDITATPTYLRQFGLMFQDYALFPHRNVKENVAFGLKMQHLPAFAVEKRVKSALAQVDLSDFGDRRVTDLSGGEQQRVALARALAPSPKLLMLDEPLGALDRGLREQLIEELHELLHKIGMPAIYVTHDQEEAFALGDRLILLHDGKVVQQGEPEEVYRSPVSVWVARFLGQKNLIEGTISSIKPLEVSTPLGIFRPGDASDQSGKGDRAVVLLKPDSASLIKNKQNVNCIQGKVVDSLFRGSGYLVRLLTENRKKLEFLLDKPLIKDAQIFLKINEQGVLCLK